MIELRLTTPPVTPAAYDVRIQTLLTFSELMMWLTKTIAESETLKDIVLDGYIICYQNENNIAAYLLCDIDSHNRLLELLKQPPGEFKGKYFAQIVNTELEHKPDEPATDSEETMTEEEKT